LSLKENTRIDLLRKHPETVARLFEIKQECIWNKIPSGSNKTYRKNFGLLTASRGIIVKVCMFCRFNMTIYIKQYLMSLSNHSTWQYRGLRIANQFHDCCSTCYKYCYGHVKLCRFNFLKLADETLLGPCIRKERDMNSKIRINVLPQRNNANINGTAFDPLLVIAHGGNHDLQYIGHIVGAAEYVASYASKSEELDKKLMSSSYAKKIS
jgi:hypothetical protein